MVVTASEVQDYLEQIVSGSGGTARITDEDGVVGGYIVHKEFIGQTVPTRQKTLHERLRQKFGDDAKTIGMIFTYTPYEFEEMFSEESA